MGHGASTSSENNISAESVEKKYEEKNSQAVKSVLDDLNEKTGEQVNVASQGKLKRLALGQQGYFDKDREYDPTLANVELNHTAAIEWTQPSLDAVSKTPTKAVKLAQSVSNSSDAKIVSSQGLSNASQQQKKAPPPPRGGYAAKRDGVIKQSNTAPTPSSQMAVSPHTVVQSRPSLLTSQTLQNALTAPTYIKSTVGHSGDQPSIPQSANSPSHNASSGHLLQPIGSSNSYNNNSGYNISNNGPNINNAIKIAPPQHNTSNHNLSHGVPSTNSSSSQNITGLPSRPFPRSTGGNDNVRSNSPSALMQTQYYTEDDDMVGIFGTQTLTPQERAALKPRDNVPILSINSSSSASISSIMTGQQGNGNSNHNLSAYKMTPQKPSVPNPNAKSGPVPTQFSSPSEKPALQNYQSPPPSMQQPVKVTYAANGSPQVSKGPSSRPSTVHPPNMALAHTPVGGPHGANLNAQYTAAVTTSMGTFPNGPGVGNIPNGRGMHTPVVKETTDVKRNRATLPEQTQHNKPTMGNWLNKRYIVNNYILLDILGTGSYGEVRLCKDRISDKLFAIKIISKDFLKKKKTGKNSSETYFEDIKREIAIMKKLSHPNVLRLYEVLDDPNVNKMYLVLEYMKQGDLINILKLRGEAVAAAANSEAPSTGNTGFAPLHDYDIWEIFKQVVSGVRYLHRQNIVHGDIKPQNLLLDDNGIVKIADFGISQMLSQSSQQIGDAAGTPAFMSPELCEGKSFSGQLADVWAIGATIFMLRFGAPPFVAKSIINLYNKIVNDPLVFPWDIDPGLRNLLENMLEKDPNRRFTIKSIMEHPWFLKKPLPPLPPRKSLDQGHGVKPSTASAQNSVGRDTASRGASRDTGKRSHTPVSGGTRVKDGGKDSRAPSPSISDADSLDTSKKNGPLSFAPPAGYEDEEAAAMNAPQNTIGNDEIFMSIGGIQKKVVKTRSVDAKITEDGDVLSDDEQDLDAGDEQVHNSADMMQTNWGEDVFGMVDDGDDSDDDGEDGNDDDEISVKVKKKKSAKDLVHQNPALSTVAESKQTDANMMQTNWGEDVFGMVDDGDVDSNDDGEDSVDEDDEVSLKANKKPVKKAKSKKELLPTAAGSKDEKSGIARKSADSSVENSGEMMAAGAYDSLGDKSTGREMSQEEQDRRAKRFVKTSTNKKTGGSSYNGLGVAETANSTDSSSGNVTDDKSHLNLKSDSKQSQTPLQTLQMRGIRTATGSSGKSPSPSKRQLNRDTMSRASMASGCGDDDEAFDELNMEEFGNMMDTLSQQPRRGKNALSEDEDEDEPQPLFSKSSLNLDGKASQLFNSFNSLAAAFHSEQGVRHSQEDRCVLLPNIALMKGIADLGANTIMLEVLNRFSMACIFDGHSGWRTSQYLAQHFASMLVMNEHFLDAKKLDFAIIETFQQIDEQICTLLRTEDDNSGSTGVVAVYDGRKNKLTVAGVGDSMCVLSRSGRAVTINHMHRLTDNLGERDRVQKAGGKVINNRVNGILAVSRAFGDTQFKELIDAQSQQVIQGGLVISQPDICSEFITPKTEFGIIATDGLWDVMSPQVAVNFVINLLNKDKDLQKAARELALEAIARGSVDNVTVLIMTFHTSVDLSKETKK